MNAQTDREQDELPDHGVMAEVDREFRRKLAERGRFETLPSGAHLCVQGHNHNALTVVLQGKLAVSCFAYGKTLQLAEVGPGETIGEMGVIDPQKASATVTVLDGPARVWTIEGDDVAAFVEENHDAGLQIYRALARELCRRIRHDSDAALRRAMETSEHFFDLDY